MDRVARGVAATEAGRIEDRAEWTEKFRWLLDDWKFVPGGRILTAAGTDQDLTYYNCYVIPSPQDSREGIMTTLDADDRDHVARRRRRHQSVDLAAAARLRQRRQRALERRGVLGRSCTVSSPGSSSRAAAGAAR